jgi:hypothetical protein
MNRVARPGVVGPDREQVAGRAEDLDAVVLAVADEDPAVGVRPDRVQKVELAGVGAGLAPGLQQGAVRREPVDPGVAVPIRDVELAILRHREAGRAVERATAVGDGAEVIRAIGDVAGL